MESCSGDHEDTLLRAGRDAQPTTVAELNVHGMLIPVHLAGFEITNIDTGTALAAQGKIGLCNQHTLVAALGWVEEVPTAVVAAKTNPIGNLPGFVPIRARHQVFCTRFLDNAQGSRAGDQPFSSTAAGITRGENQANIQLGAGASVATFATAAVRDPKLVVPSDYFFRFIMGTNIVHGKII
jgi:hypothetical protein